ncbi:hypothetical protein DFJ74DRAFT_705524 [Hyaloraphidium curvatum]|nr:hypothetical protein DFJ74DRAFT_705524 [Hyaloraphidium curvatum]
MFRQLHRPRDNVVRIERDGKIPRGKIGIRGSGTVTMSVHFFRPPTPGSRFILMDMESSMMQGIADHAIYLFDAGIARQIQHMWAVQNPEDEAAGIKPKL